MSGELIGDSGRVDFQVEWFTASQFVHLAADEGIGKGGVAPNQGFRKCRHRLGNKVLELGGAKLFEHIRNRSFLGCFLISLPVFLLLRFHQTKPCFQFAAATLQAAGNLGKQIVTILDAGSYVSWRVLQFALALEIKGIEQHLGHGFRVLLSQKPTGECLRYSLIREQFLQINSNQQAAFRCEPEGSSRNRDSRCVSFFRRWFLFGPNLLARLVQKLDCTH